MNGNGTRWEREDQGMKVICGGKEKYFEENVRDFVEAGDFKEFERKWRFFERKCDFLRENVKF
jgi:hypothetical protein